jgi:hypothetical protein
LGNSFLVSDSRVYTKPGDLIGKNDDLGHVLVPAINVCSANGDQQEFKLQPPKGKDKMDAGYITIRCSPASPEDHKEKKGFLGIKPPSINLPFQNSSNHGSKRGSEDSAAHANEPTIPLFIEIVSCKGLLPMDKTGSSDPYVKVKLGKKDLHETKHIVQNLNPVYTPETNSFFVMEASPQELYGNDGLVFKVKVS